MNEHNHVRFNYNQIDDQIFLGTNFCCQTEFERSLLDLGVTADLSLEGERVDAPFGIQQYLWLPTKDHHAPTLYQLQQGVQFIALVIEQKGKVYIHCMNGHGRGPTMLAAYYIAAGMTVDDAIHKIMLKRPEIHINDEQRNALEEFEMVVM